MKNNKTFDCVEMKHEGAKRILFETQKMTISEQLEYWKKKTTN